MNWIKIISENASKQRNRIIPNVLRGWLNISPDLSAAHTLRILISSGLLSEENKIVSCYPPATCLRMYGHICAPYVKLESWLRINAQGTNQADYLSVIKYQFVQWRLFYTLQNSRTVNKPAVHTSGQDQKSYFSIRIGIHLTTVQTIMYVVCSQWLIGPSWTVWVS